tara:strand:+ start:1031 stop:1573 length:543 start_codon:yes stop_codon:yes gene_type:complete
MANHVLSLEIPTVANACVFKIFDTSVYSPLVGIFRPLLYITLPGYTCANELSFVPDSSPTLTACDLGIQTEGCGTSYVNLPDGIYVIKYAIDPECKVFVEYNHLRITCALNQYEKILCNISVADCDPPAKIKERLRDLGLIRMYLEAAKAKIEVCHRSQEGMTLFNYAVKLLNKFDCKNC